MSVSRGKEKGTEKGVLNSLKSMGRDLGQQVLNFNVSLKRSIQFVGLLIIWREANKRSSQSLGAQQLNECSSKTEAEGVLGTETGETIATKSGKSFIASAKWLALFTTGPREVNARCIYTWRDGML